jgi:glutathione synthase
MERAFKGEGGCYIQPLSMGIFRSDYMLHQQPISTSRDLELKQVEFNTMSCARGTHTNIINTVHRLAATSLYTSASALPPHPPLSAPHHHNLRPRLRPRNRPRPLRPPQNRPRHHHHNSHPRPTPQHQHLRRPPLEYALWAASPRIPCYRIDHPSDFLARTTLSATSELLFYRPRSPLRTYARATKPASTAMRA